MKIRFDRNGTARTLYGEEINLAELGVVELRRASHVEPTKELLDPARAWLLDRFEDITDHLAAHESHAGRQRWWADMMPMNGPVLGPFDTRSEALKAERVWIDDHGILQLPLK